MANFNEINFFSKKNQPKNEMNSASESSEITAINNTISAVVEAETVDTNVSRTKPTVTVKTADSEFVANKKSNKFTTKGFRVEKNPKKLDSDFKGLEKLLTKDLNQKEQNKVLEDDIRSPVVKLEDNEPAIPMPSEPNSAAAIDDPTDEEDVATASSASTKEEVTIDDLEVQPDITMTRMKYNYLQRIESQIEFRDETKFIYKPNGSIIPNNVYRSSNVSVQRTGCRYEYGFIPGNPYADNERDFFNKILIIKKPEKFKLTLRNKKAKPEENE